MSAPFHHFACKFPWRLEDDGWGGQTEHVQDAGNGQSEEREEKEERKRRCDDRAEDAVFVHASAGKLITRWSPTPLKC